MAPILGRPLTSFIFVDPGHRAAVERAEQDLMQTAITQPAVLTVDDAILRLLGEYGFAPDWVMGHSLGEYGALVAAGAMPFADAVEASAARGREMTRVSLGDNGWMAAVLAPLAGGEETLAEVDGYVVAANINSTSQAVIGGDAAAVARAIEVFTAKGFQAFRLPVSHAFHTRIVAPAAEPLRRMLNGIRVTPPRLPLVANVTGERYAEDVEAIKDMLAKQIASPVQWVKGLQTLYAEGVRTFVEVGPKKALKGFTDDVLGAKPDVISLFTNHPKTGAIQSFNQALCGLYAAGYGRPAARAADVRPIASNRAAIGVPAAAAPAPARASAPLASGPGEVGGGYNVSASTPAQAPASQASLDALAQLLAQVLHGASHPQRLEPDDRNAPPKGSVVVTGAGLGLPGAEKAVMDPSNTARVLRGEQFIDLLPERFRVQMARKHVTRVVKSEDGSGRFETIDDTADVIKLAGRPGRQRTTDREHPRRDRRARGCCACAGARECALGVWPW
jgi:acyl transferase domain-containing protein